MPSLMDKYSDIEFEQIVLNSSSYKNCLLNLGYTSNSGDSTNRLKKKIQALNIDISHFSSVLPIVRTKDNVFVENSTADQKTLRKWYIEGGYSEYKCAICGQEPFWNSKELTLILDHINGYNHDDRLENLRWVCPNCNYQLDTTNGKNINHKNHKVNLCKDCGKTISPSSTYCFNCYTKNKATNEIKGLSRNELKTLLRTTSFVQIGAKYNVSDNAVRKWCDKYNLPRKSSEIKAYTDEEWALI